MCLIITGSAHDIRSTLLNTIGLLEDIFKTNSDGVGAMYATTKHGLRVVKDLPRDAAACTAFIRRLPDDDRDLAIHFRWRTHGATDLENCHPYMVKPGLAMMHNGILAHGNAADPSKSDTWHYIHNYLAPLEEKYPGITEDENFQCVVENDIADNRFVFLDSHGVLTIYNRDQGIEHEGLWFSNTYAWHPEMLIKGYKKTYALTSYRGDKWWERSNYYNDGYGGLIAASPAHAGLVDDDCEMNDYGMGDDDSVFDPDGFMGDVWSCLSVCDDKSLLSMLEEAPTFLFESLFASSRFVVNPEYALALDTLKVGTAYLIRLLLDEDVAKLVTHVRRSRADAAALSEVMSFNGTWDDRITAPTPLTEEELAEVYCH